MKIFRFSLLNSRNGLPILAAPSLESVQVVENMLICNKIWDLQGNILSDCAPILKSHSSFERAKRTELDSHSGNCAISKSCKKQASSKTIRADFVEKCNSAISEAMCFSKMAILLDLKSLAEKSVKNYVGQRFEQYQK